MKKLITLMLLLGCGSVSAVPVHWTLNNVVLEHQNTLGGSSEIRYFNVTGSFVYNADTNEYSDISVTTDPSTFPPLTSDVWPGQTYTGDNFHYDATSSFYSGPLTSANSEGITLAASFYNGALFWLQNGLRLSYESPLTNAGGSVALALDGASFERLNGEIAGCCLDHRYVVSGSLNGTVVPIPAAVWLFGSSLGLLGWIRRRLAV